MEGKEKYEFWEKNSKGGFSGYGYKIKDEEKTILENLEIRFSKGQAIFEATVLDQNEGNTIPFTLNAKVKDQFSFENPDHDFPKKVQYQLTSPVF